MKFVLYFLILLGSFAFAQNTSLDIAKESLKIDFFV